MRMPQPRTCETITFEALETRVTILRRSQRLVGIEVAAPAEFAALGGSSESSDIPPRRELTHRQRNWLNTAALALHLAAKQLAARQEAEAEAMLQTALEKLRELDNALAAQVALDAEGLASPA